MTFRADSDFEKEETMETTASANWLAATAVSVLIIATITLTVVAGGLSFG
jgi:hypothetical protein